MKSANLLLIRIFLSWMNWNERVHANRRMHPGIPDKYILALVENNKMMQMNI